MISPRANEPLGRQRYWPIFAAAEAANLPLGLHQANINGGHPSTGSRLADLLHAGALRLHAAPAVGRRSA